MKQSEEMIVVCGRVGDPDIGHISGSSEENKCSRCSSYVRIAPSSMKFLAEHSEAKVICGECFAQEAPSHVIVELAIAGSLEDIRREIAEARAWEK